MREALFFACVCDGRSPQNNAATFVGLGSSSRIVPRFSLFADESFHATYNIYSPRSMPEQRSEACYSGRSGWRIRGRFLRCCWESARSTLRVESSGVKSSAYKNPEVPKRCGPAIYLAGPAIYFPGPEISREKSRDLSFSSSD